MYAKYENENTNRTMRKKYSCVWFKHTPPNYNFIVITKYLVFGQNVAAHKFHNGVKLYLTLIQTLIKYA